MANDQWPPAALTNHQASIIGVMAAIIINGGVTMIDQQWPMTP